MVNIIQLKEVNERRWKQMIVLPQYAPVIDLHAHRLITQVARSRYTIVSAQTTVPWWVIAVIHERESSQSWAAGLAQGDPWDKISIHRPEGIGPFDSWESAAMYALRSCAPHAAKWQDWSMGGSLSLLEQYNGLGYSAHGVPSPYIWAATDQYHSGKFISDGHYDPNAIDHQLGCAALLYRMQALDPSIRMGE